ncbi:MAG: c-type cytochrome [Methyloceanibacter sp.]
MRIQRMRAKIAALASALTVTLLLMGGHVVGAPLPGQPDPQSGKALAEKLCTNCHLIGGAQQEHAVVDVPSFHEIANRQDQSTGAIVSHIVLPKHPMPQIPLTKSELADLSAYIMSLRDRP